MMLEVEQLLFWRRNISGKKLFIHMCRYVSDSLQDEVDVNTQWTGRINALKKTVKAQAKSILSNQDQMRKEMTKEINKENKEMTNKMR